MAMQVDPKHRASGGLAVYIDNPRVLFDNTIHRGQIKTSPQAHILGGEKGSKDIFLNFSSMPLPLSLTLKQTK